MRVFFFVFLAALPLPAHAASVDLFKVLKPVHQENILVVQARVEGCRVKDLDFLWWMNVDSKGRPQSVKRSAAEGMIRKRFKITPTNSKNAASCQKAVAPGTPCNSISAGALELGWVDHKLADPALVVRAERGASGCQVGAYLDLGSRVVKVKSIKIRADNIRMRGFLGLTTGADFRVLSVTVEPSEGPPIAPWPCTKDCQKSEP